MKVRITRTIGTQDCLPRNDKNPTSPELPKKADGSMYQENEVVNLADADAQKLLAFGLAERVGADEAAKAKPATPSTEAGR